MSRARYPDYPEQVNDLLRFAREARRLERLYPDDVNAADMLQHVTDLAGDWAWDLLDLVLDHEERGARFWTKWKAWRKAAAVRRQPERPPSTHPQR